MAKTSIHFNAATGNRSRLSQRGFSALRWLVGLLVGCVLLMLLAMVVITHWDWNSARPWVAQQVSKSTGREFRIEGDLSADWHWPQPLEQGFRRWIPGVTVQAQNILLGNPEGFLVEDEPARGQADLPALPAKTRPSGKPSALAASAARPASAAAAASVASTSAPSPHLVSNLLAGAVDNAPSEQADAEDARRLMQRERAALDVEAPPRTPSTMLTIARATATLRLLPLLQRTIALDTIVLTAPDIALARNQQGETNWEFKQSSQPASEPWSLSLGQLIVRGGWLGYADGAKDLAVRAYIDTFEPEGDDENEQDAKDESRPQYGVHMTLQGRYGKARIEGEGLAGPILSLRKTSLDYPIHLKLQAGSLRAEAEGILANPRELSGLDMQVSLRGASMADLYPLTGLVLPSTPAFKTRGRLLGDLGPGKAIWEYRDFDGVVGASDLHGSLTYTSAQPRPRLEGRMLSKKLRLVDLGPLVGNSSTQEVALRRKGRVLPDTPFDTGRWNAMDLDIAFTGEKIVRPANLPIENLSTRAVLKDAQLSLSPLRFGVAKGKINADLVLDSRNKSLKVRLNGSANDLQLGALFPKVELMKKSFGQLDGAFSLVTQGNSVASMLGGSTGEVKLFVRDGMLSKEMLDLAALNLGSVIVTKLFGAQKEVQLRCAVADFAVRDGLATTRVAKLSTEEAIIEATGSINLKNETLDLNIKPESLKWKFFSLRTPLYVKGSFAEPNVGLEKGPLILRAGAAVIAAVAAPVALALVPVTVPAAQDDANCKALLAAVTKPGRP
ncbi:AsmA family protein [Diaphorobacter sp. HDW4B]|uniref:AsmA family protein n=1 Tax=Diaphorobacter sp. HDW4B TaxID=2714925 RepID=UPI001408E1BF|nr:AsmA family protein [Diaphorobacter sp. HDW4B]QIL72973.1 AsmA family protein [Diaphorobacter sp. HDW4B]